MGEDMPSYAKPPRDDDEYFERMSHAIFQAGLNWEMVEKKWPSFRKAFSDFSVDKVARFSERKFNALMEDTSIVRNGAKIKSVIINANAFKKVRAEFGSFPKYIKSFHGDEARMADDLQQRFRHLGPSSARMYMWLIGMNLKPNAEEKAWLSKHHSPH
jgi:3-methyladenine DNA glycosylase Tag